MRARIRYAHRLDRGPGASIVSMGPAARMFREVRRYPRITSPVVLLGSGAMSFGRRVDRIGGKRRASRERVLAAATAVTLDDGKLVVLTNVSTTGARIRGAALKPGKDIWIRTGPIDTLATVVWRRQDLCGVRFDQSLSATAVKELQRATRAHVEARRTPEEQLAVEDWMSGFAR